MKQAPLQTQDDLLHIKESILIPVILDVLERDIKTLNSLDLKMPELYIRNLRRIQKQIIADLSILVKRSRTAV